MPVVAWMAVGVSGGLASFAVIGLVACVIIRHRRPPTMTSSASLTTDVDDERAAGSPSDGSDAGSCSPVQDIAVSQSTPDLIGHDRAGYLATGRAPDEVIDGAFHPCRGRCCCSIIPLCRPPVKKAIKRATHTGIDIIAHGGNAIRNFCCKIQTQSCVLDASIRSVTETSLS